MIDIQDFESLVFYYGRSEFYHTMQITALDGLGKYPNHLPFRLYNGISLVLGNRIQEGIRELNPLKNDGELGMAAVIALLYAHRRCSAVDEDAVAHLEQRLKEICANVNALYNAALFLFLAKKIEEASEHIENALKLDAQHESTIILKAWLEMSHVNVNGNVMHALEQILARVKSIDAVLCLARFFQQRSDFESAMNLVSKLSVRYPEMIIPLVVKMDIQLSALDWDRSYETALRIINLEPTNIAALRVKTLLLVRDGNIKGGISTLQQLLVATDRVEVGNLKLLLQICQLFARICSRNTEMLTLSLRFIDKLIQSNPSDVDCIVELANHRMFLENIKEASICYRSATRIENNNFFALCGITLCNLLETGITEQTLQQVQFLGDIRTDTHPLMLFIRAKTSTDSDKALLLLTKAVEIHMKKLEGISVGPEYFLKLDPEFLLLVTTEFLRHSPLQTNMKQDMNLMQETLHVSLKHCVSILEVILKFCPSHIHALCMKSKVHFLCGEITLAYPLLYRIINDLDSANTDAYLLLAQILMQQQQYSKALQYLEIALSVNFLVRENPKYYLLLGMGQRRLHQYVEAQKSLMAAMHGSVLGNETAHDNAKSSKWANALAFNTFTVSDKVTLYLELISTYKDIGDAHGAYESERLLQCALEEFNNTSEEGRLVIAHAEFLLQNSNINKAVELLSAMQPGQSYYVQAKTNLANIYLNYRKDRVAFARCFKDLAETCPESQSFIMLGEAYMSIQEPDLAIEAYRKAFDMNPQDSQLANKLGRAYVKTHQYTKAIAFYKEVLTSLKHSVLKLNFAELYLKLRQYKNAQEVLDEGHDDQKQMDLLNIEELQMRTKRLLLLARIHEKSGNNNLAMQTLEKAKENQLTAQKRVYIQQTGNTQEQEKMLSKICLLMAKHCISLRKNDQALAYFKECLKYDPNDIDVLISLSHFYMQVNSMELCRDVCLQILQIDSNNEATSVMMADLSFRKMDFENAAYHFSQLLLAQPCYWTALARLIEVMRRAGSLTDAISFLERAEKNTSNPDLTPGLNYCRGLYEWYTGNPNRALRYFNTARRDYEWGPQAISNMIEICINPDGDIPSGSDMFEASDNSEFNDARAIALRTADRLLKELHPSVISVDKEAINHILLQNFLKLASKQKFQIESALQDFTELSSREDLQGTVGPTLGMAMAFVQLKQTQRAKFNLKRLARMEWNFEEAEFLERGWLLLADVYISGNKWDVADALVTKVLDHNKSCAKAFELAGYIAEKSQLYSDATKNYSNAWKCYGHAKPHIGYKLAYNYMKAKHFADAIEICQQVLKLNPDYNVIKKDILYKCRNNLRI